METASNRASAAVQAARGAPKVKERRATAESADRLWVGIIVTGKLSSIDRIESETLGRCSYLESPPSQILLKRTRRDAAPFRGENFIPHLPQVGDKLRLQCLRPVEQVMKGG